MKKLTISKPFGCYRKFGINKKAQEKRDNLILLANTLSTMSNSPYYTFTMSTSNTANGWEWQWISSWAQNTSAEYNFRQGMKF